MSDYYGDIVSLGMEHADIAPSMTFTQMMGYAIPILLLILNLILVFYILKPLKTVKTEDE